MNVIREINLVFLAEENVLRNEYNLPVFCYLWAVAELQVYSSDMIVVCTFLGAFLHLVKQNLCESWWG